jgi:hypothetical protein
MSAVSVWTWRTRNPLNTSRSHSDRFKEIDENAKHGVIIPEQAYVTLADANLFRRRVAVAGGLRLR